MNESMSCEQCEDEHFGEPALLNIHGMLASEGEPACWGHSYEDDWWPCQKKAAEEHAMVGKLLAACEAAEEALEDRMDNASNPEAMQRWLEQCERAAVLCREAIAKAKEPS